MKGIKNIFGIIAISAIIGSFIACAEDDDPPPSKEVIPSGNLGETLAFANEQVYTEQRGSSVTYTEYTSTQTIVSSAGGTPTIAAGKFSYTVGTPSTDLLYNISTVENYGLFWEFETVTYKKSDTTDAAAVQAHILKLAESASPGSNELQKKEDSRSSSSVSYKKVDYLYVADDVTVTGKGKTEEVYDGYTVKTVDTTLALKKGWNAVYSIQSHPAEANSTTDVSYSIGNPALKWVLED
jgi:hypothetical protein